MTRPEELPELWEKQAAGGPEGDAASALRSCARELREALEQERQRREKLRRKLSGARAALQSSATDATKALAQLDEQVAILEQW